MGGEVIFRDADMLVLHSGCLDRPLYTSSIAISQEMYDKRKVSLIYPLSSHLVIQIINRCDGL